MTISEKNRVIARRKKIDLTTLAAKTNQTRQNLSNKLTRNNWTEDQARAAASALGCSFDPVFIDNETGEQL